MATPTLKMVSLQILVLAFFVIIGGISMYDYLIVGSGLFGAVFAHEMKSAGKSCLVLERRDHVGGNVYCEEKEGIRIHKYGPIFSIRRIRWSGTM